MNASRANNPLFGPNRFKLGVFSANCDGGLTMSLAPERWGANWDDPDAYLAGEPGPGIELAEWMCAHGVALTGCDTWSYGPVPAEDPRRPFAVPQELNVRHGVFVVENLDTAALAAAGARQFALILTHPRLRGATGAWTSPIALV